MISSVELDQLKILSQAGMVLVLTSIYSLDKYSLDLKCDETLMKVDLILLTETQLVDNSHKELLKSVFVNQFSHIEKSELDIRLRCFDD